MNLNDLPAQTLLVNARLESAAANLLCRALIEHNAAAREVNAALQRDLALGGLTESGFSVLIALLAHTPRPVLRSDLALAAGLTTMRTDDAVVRLEMSRLVRRERDPEDRRLVWLCLTADGLARINEAIRRRIAAAAIITAALRDDELSASVAISQKLRNGAQQLVREHAANRD